MVVVVGVVVGKDVDDMQALMLLAGLQKEQGFSYTTFLESRLEFLTVVAPVAPI